MPRYRALLHTTACLHRDRLEAGSCGSLGVGQKAMLVDMVYLQQDAFDPVDVSNEMERQKQSFGLLTNICRAELNSPDKAEARRWFSRLTDTFKNLNYAEVGSDPHEESWAQIESLVRQASGSGSSVRPDEDDDDLSADKTGEAPDD